MARMSREDWRLPLWAAVLCIAFGVMGGYLVAVFDAVFLFSGTGPRFVVVFVISSIVGAGLFYAWAVTLKMTARRREETRKRFENMSDRQVWLMAIGLLILGTIWVVQKLSWL